jgi:hypothetical protein
MLASDFTRLIVVDAKETITNNFFLERPKENYYQRTL